MAGLVGEYECKLDAKGRFLFPSGLRKQLSPEANEVFMMNKGFENCLTLYPQNEWDKVSVRLSKLNLFKPKNRMFYRLFHQGAKQLGLDNAGRVLVPSDLLKRIGLSREIMLTAYNDRIEVWSKEEYLSLMGEGMADFADLADEVMGEIDNENE